MACTSCSIDEWDVTQQEERQKQEKYAARIQTTRKWEFPEE